MDSYLKKKDVLTNVRSVSPSSRPASADSVKDKPLIEIEKKAECVNDSCKGKLAKREHLESLKQELKKDIISVSNVLENLTNVSKLTEDVKVIKSEIDKKLSDIEKRVKIIEDLID